MIIAVASGKGGTGKTLFSVALAQAAKSECLLLDCDVEEPNAHIFIKAQKTECENVSVLIPVIDEKKCTYCGKCGEVCEFNAIAVLQEEVMVFDELCHSCGGCVLVCPEQAVSEKNAAVGKITKGKVDFITLVEGKVKVGSVLIPPVIRTTKKHIEKDKLNIIDCPPGTACQAVTSMYGADYVILVTEATPFGLHDLKLSVDVVRELDIPFGVIINRCDTGFLEVVRYCDDEAVDILLQVPESIAIAKAYSKGESLISAMPEIKNDFIKIIETITRGVA